MEDNKRQRKIARVLVEISLNRHFDYYVPKELEKDIDVGTYVNVPFGNRKQDIRACVISFPSSSDCQELRFISSLYVKSPKIPEKLLRLGNWIAEYYCCSKEQALKTLLPGAVRSGKISKKNVKYVFLKDTREATEYLFNKCEKAHKRAEVLKFLLNRSEVSLSLLKKKTEASDAVINRLIKDNVAVKESRNVERDPFEEHALVPHVSHKLNEEQKIACDEIYKMMHKESEYFTALLFGVTGSGKTEVYLNIIEENLRFGKEAIVLVPEISLTPQTTERFRAKFGDAVSVLHSGLSDGERFDEWMKVYEGRVKIAIGARSALFAPFNNLGLIIVDEEHETSYKQNEAPRYNARDVAVMRSYMENAVAVLGTATPSLESYYNCEKGKYKLLKMKSRIDNRMMPKVVTVDMTATSSSGSGSSIFSKEMIDAVNYRLEQGEQVILFLNRRGYATYMSCPECDYVAICPECSVSYTYHRYKGCLSCHICGSIVSAPPNCPKCKSPDIKYSGIGTEKIETITSGIFKDARVKRMDSDTMTNRKSYETVLQAFRKGSIDILIGTQMIAKGLDFPNVTLVGIINADTALHMPDFRAAEKTFQLLTQVSGRSGRGEIPGEVMIQTRTPFNSAIVNAVNHDYESFYEEEIDIRKQLKYPPANHLLLLKFFGMKEEKVQNIAENFSSALSSMLTESMIASPPVPAPITKMKNNYRYLIIVRGNFSKKFKRKLSKLVFDKFKNKEVKIIIDIDARSLL